MEFDRDAALNIAVERFWMYGFEAVSVSDLADAMSIQRSSFYNSFTDRETIFQEALQAYLRTAPDAPLARLQPGRPVKTAIRNVFREICRVRSADAAHRGCLVVNSIGELVGVHPKLGGALAHVLRQSVRVYERLIRRAVEQGEIEPPDDIRAAAKAFVAFVSGLNTLSKVVRSERELWRMCADFLHRYGFADAPPAR